MIRVLVMAAESLFADFIVSILSQENDLDVFRVSRDELGLRRDYSVVIVVDDGLADAESIKLKEIIRGNITLLLIRVSPMSKIVFVDESYQLINPGMEKLVDLVRDFHRENLEIRLETDAGSEKNINQARHTHTEIYDRQNPISPAAQQVAMAQDGNCEKPLSTRDDRLPPRQSSFIAFLLHQLRRKYLRNVTMWNRLEHLTSNVNEAG